MSNFENGKPNYKDANFNHEYYSNQSSYDRQANSYPPMPSYTQGRTIYDDKEVNGKDFILGVIIGGVIGAATALLLAPKTGTEMRSTLSSQAGQLKEKTIDLSSTAKEKTTQLSKQIQEQSEQLVDKVKSFKGTPSSPQDDGTVSSEGEEPMEFMETITNTSDEQKAQEENATAIAEAIKEAVSEENKNK